MSPFDAREAGTESRFSAREPSGEARRLKRRLKDDDRRDMKSRGSGRPPLYKLVLAFCIAGLGVGSGDYFLVTHRTGLYGSAVIGVGCGLIVVLVAWQGDNLR
jgi:hypothetical protein